MATDRSRIIGYAPQKSWRRLWVIGIAIWITASAVFAAYVMHEVVPAISR